MSGAVTVTQLNAYIARVIKAEALLAQIKVTGEISNITKHRSGHVFFTLKDASSAVRCFLPSAIAAKITDRLADGEEIIAEGYVQVYEKGGSYSLNIRQVTRSGEGDLARNFEKLKQKLLEKGYFDPSAKKPLPAFPENIAIVTSPTGAAIEDMLSIIKSKNSVVNVRLFPSLVQGEDAARMLAGCVSYINRSFAGTDLIIIGRGGGSAEDLMAFNEEVLADAIYASEIPVISAVGHETDFSISDFTADARAETPTAAAHMAVPDVFKLMLSIDTIISDMQNSVFFALSNARKSLPDERLLLARLKTKLQLAEMKVGLTDFSSLRNSLAARLCAQRSGAGHLAEAMRKEVARVVERCEFAAAMQETALTTLNPLAVLSRGYSIIQDENGRVVSSASALAPGDNVNARFKDGTAAMEVKGRNEVKNVNE
ncbi:MAG: exodeoxyribonuclease VII large subunit [Clostridiales Family XIII bacterium]|jgi:exodeoxyribonuclease VII large subunit|nr:exodeoxyribonuclease VII large subunit [Clostridiales Family XIII bacterium]